MITCLNHITLAVQDVERSFNFYQGVLGFQPLCKWHKGAYFLVGDTWFCLNHDPARQANPCYTHYAFSVEPENFEAMCERLQNAQVRIFKNNTSPGESLYFLDPDDHKLEIHVGDWPSRIKAKKENPGQWQDVVWYV